MAVTVTTAIREWLGSESARQLSPTARLILLLLGDAVNESRVQAGYPWEAYISQERLAALCGVSDRQVRRILREQLEGCDIIEDTLQRVGRGVVKWEIREEALRTPTSTLDADVRADADVRNQGKGGHGLPVGRTSAASTADADVRSGRKPTSVQPEGNQKPKEPEEEPGRSPSAPDVPSPPETATTTATATTPSLAATQAAQTNNRHVEAAERERLLAGLEADLKRKPKDPATLRAIETVKADTGGLAEAAGVELLEVAG